ncbi:MAG TPA: hypothetical protein VK138_14090 [Acidiferrobacterales bacterium]|nr:hypothetical protein [Acidiferrobacterales bacterium]
MRHLISLLIKAGKVHPWPFPARKAKNVIFAFLHFSITDVIEKWQYIPIPRSVLKSSVF